MLWLICWVFQGALCKTNKQLQSLKWQYKLPDLKVSELRNLVNL